MQELRFKLNGVSQVRLIRDEYLERCVEILMTTEANVSSIVVTKRIVTHPDALKRQLNATIK